MYHNEFLSFDMDFIGVWRVSISWSRRREIGRVSNQLHFLFLKWVCFVRGICRSCRSRRSSGNLERRERVRVLNE